MKIYWDGDSKNIIGMNLKSLRRERKMTQKALAEQLQLRGYEFSPLTILRIEKGERFVPDYEVKALCQFFEISADDLLENSK